MDYHKNKVKLIKKFPYQPNMAKKYLTLIKKLTIKQLFELYLNPLLKFKLLYDLNLNI